MTRVPISCKASPSKSWLALVATLAAVFSALAPDASAATQPSAAYTFTRIARLGDAAPGPEDGTFEGDFEPYGINDRAEVSFAADLSTGGEGVFVARSGAISQPTLFTR